jgi:iron complex transport system substrate-binding protein
MSLRSPAWFAPLRNPCLRVLAFVLVAAGASPAIAKDFIDSGGRRVVVPDHINRVMAADPTGEVLVFVLTPQKLIGWARAPERGLLPAKYARLPVIGQLTGPRPTATAETVKRLRPDLVIDGGTVTPERVAFADQMQQATGTPYLLVDDSIARTPALLRTIGTLFGVEARGGDLGLYAEYAIDSLRGRLLVQSPVGRPRVYYGRGPSGLEAALPDTRAGEAIEEAGAINVAAALGPGAPPVITLAQLRQWDPAIIIVEDRGFYAALRRDPAWRVLSAVHSKRVYLAPSSPFGWIDEPAGVNRLIGLYWLSALLYPGDNQEDVGTQVHDFYDKFYGTQLSDKQVAAIVRMAGVAPPPAETPMGPPGLLNYTPPTGTGMPPLPGTSPPGRNPLPAGGLPPVPLPPSIPKP